jgi:hypothetical protein
MEQLVMEDEYIKNRNEPFIVNGPDGPSTFEVVSKGISTPLMVTMVENFTAAVKASNEINKRQTDSIIKFVDDNMDLVSDGLDKWMQESDKVHQVQSYVQEIFSNLPDLLTISDVIGQILLNL